MKFLKYSVMAVLGLAVSMTSCSEDKYVPGAQSPGAYFDSNLPASVELSQEGGTFEIALNRTADGPESYTVTLTDPSGLFTTPATVNFGENATSTNLVLSFDPASIEMDKEYALSLNVTPASEYGNASYSVTVMRKTPLVTKNIADVIWTFGGSPFGPGDNRRDVVLSYSPNTPNAQTYTILDFVGDDESAEDPAYEPFPNIEITVPDASNLTNGRTPARIKPQPIGISNSTGPIWIADMASFYTDFFGNPQGEDAYGADSYYEPERGLFTFHLCYFLPTTYDAASGNVSWFGDSNEYMQLPGFPELSVEVEYLGTMFLPNGDYMVNANITPAADVASFKAALVSGRDAAPALEAINAGAEGVQEFKGNQAVRAEFPVTEGGFYTLAVQTYDAAGKVGENSSVTFNLTIGASDKPTLVGQASYLDGFLGPRFSNPVNVEYAVNLLQDKSNKNIYYLESPYTQEGFSLSIVNENEDAINVAFDVTDPTFVLFPQQYSGFTNKQYYGGDVEIGNLEAVVAAQNPDLSYETIKNALASDEKDPVTEFSSYEDGVVYVCNCMFSNGGQFGYQLKSNPVGIIAFPQAAAAAKSKALARNVTRPNFQGMAKIARKTVKDRFSKNTLRKLSVENFRTLNTK